MPTEYTPDNPLTDEEVYQIARQALPQTRTHSIDRISRGSTSLVYRLTTAAGDLILKIAHRSDRIAPAILNKEARVLRQFENHLWPIPIPKVIWSGTTAQGFLALIETALQGKGLEHLLSQDIDGRGAMLILGQYVATLHGLTGITLNEFENGREVFPNFTAYVQHYLKEWLPLLMRAPHLRSDELAEAHMIIETGLADFTETSWPYVHGDISQENSWVNFKIKY